MRVGDHPAASSLSQVVQVGSHGSVSSRGHTVLDRLQGQLYIQIKYMVSIKPAHDSHVQCSNEKSERRASWISPQLASKTTPTLRTTSEYLN